MSKQSPKIIYSDLYEVDLGDHPFPTSKYRLIKEYLLDSGYIKEKDIIKPKYPDRKLIWSVHTKEYTEKILDGKLSLADEIKLEMPYSAELAKAYALACAGSVLAADNAFSDGAAIHLGGGFHHAYADHGEGFCLFNDVAIAAKHITKKNKRVLIADCDLHQGNGTAAILKDDKNAFTFSIHQENNYPILKEKSDLDIPLEDSVSGDKYNNLLEKNLRNIRKDFKPDIVIYVAGSDPYVDDKLGGLNLNIGDFKDRDKIIKEEFFDRRIPVIVLLAGGYARDLTDTVAIHAGTAVTFLNA